MEKKILIIPDVHGRRFWRDAIESDDYDKVIFLGDYVDPYPNEGIGSFTAQEGLERIILYHDEHPDKVVLLLGNHDLHYMYEDFHAYSPCDRYNKAYCDCYGSLLMEGKDAVSEGYISEISLVPAVVGIIVAAVIGWLSIRFMLKLIGKVPLAWFALYLAVIGVIYLVLQLTGSTVVPAFSIPVSV